MQGKKEVRKQRGNEGWRKEGRKENDKTRTKTRGADRKMER